MRAREFTINVPITIKINGDGDPEIDMPNQNQNEPDEPEVQSNPVMISPLQQELELKKAEHGKESPILDKITQDSNLGAEDDDTTANDNSLLNAIKQLIAR